MAWYAAAHLLALRTSVANLWDQARGVVEATIEHPGGAGWRARGELVEWWSLDGFHAEQADVKGEGAASMETQRMYVQTLADASPGRAIALIQNAGLVLSGIPSRSKPLLALKLAKTSGVVLADANVGLLMAGAKAAKPTGNRFFNWQATFDGSKTFVTLPPTSSGKTTLANLTPLTTVGVRVNLNNGEGPGEWTPVVSILVM